jgi:hypothetical protein
MSSDGMILYAGMDPDITPAHQHAVDRAWAHLVGDRGLEPFEASARAKLEMRPGGPASPIVLACLPTALN